MKFYLVAARGAEGVGAIVADGFVVFMGSRMANSVTKSFPASSNRIRQKLLDNSIVDSDYVFTKDYIFSSPSTAASIVLGVVQTDLPNGKLKKE